MLVSVVLTADVGTNVSNFDNKCSRRCSVCEAVESVVSLVIFEFLGFSKVNGGVYFVDIKDFDFGVLFKFLLDCLVALVEISINVDFPFVCRWVGTVVHCRLSMVFSVSVTTVVLLCVVSVL